MRYRYCVRYFGLRDLSSMMLSSFRLHSNPTSSIHAVSNNIPDLLTCNTVRRKELLESGPGTIGSRRRVRIAHGPIN